MHSCNAAFGVFCGHPTFRSEMNEDHHKAWQGTTLLADNHRLEQGVFHRQHDPVLLPNGNILVANHQKPHRAIEVDLNTGKIVWQSPEFERDAIPVRDANRLPNGNTLVTGTTKIIEFTTEGEIVWQLKLKGVYFANQRDRPRLGFYKAERIAPQ